MIVLLSGIGVGIWSGNALGLIWGIVIGFLSWFVGTIALILIWDTMTSRLLCKALGVSDVRCLK